MKKFLFILTLSLLCAEMSWAQNVAKNANTGVEYATLQAAIDAADPNQTIVLLTDINVSQVISVVKNLTIDGKKHIINTTATRGLWTDANGVHLTLKNFILHGGSNTNRGIQVNDPNVTIFMDSCRIITQHYAIMAIQYDLGNNPNNNLHMTVTNSYIQGLTALRSFAPEATFSFDKDTLHGINNYTNCDEDDNNFAVIMMEGFFSYGDGQGSKNSNLSVTNSVIIAQTTGNCSEEWIGLADGASDVTVTVDANTKIINEEEVDKSDQINIKTGGPRNTVTMPLTTVQKDSLARFYTLTDNGDGTTTVSTAIVYYYWTTGGTYIDFHVPFEPANLVSGEYIYLREDVKMRQNVTANINGNFFLNFEDGSETYSITQGEYSIMLREGTTCTTDKQATGLFTSPDGLVEETDNGDGTFTYAITPYVALNMNTGTGYTNLQSAVDAVNAGDTIRILRNINLTSMVNVNASVVNNFTIDLNGDTISFSGSGSNDAAIRILNGAELTIKDNGTNGAIINPGKGSAVLGGYGTLVLKSGTLEGKGSSTNALYLWATGTTTMGSATINGGMLKSASGMAVRHRGDMLTINDGTFISGNNNVIQNQSNAEINGGTFTPGTASRYAIYNTGTMTINDATTNGTGGSLSNSGKMTVNDGVFHSIGGNAAYNSGADTLTINSGDFYVSATNGFRNTNNAGTFLFNGGTVTDHGVTQSVIYNTGKFVMTGVEISASAADYTVWIDANGIFETHNGKIENTNADQSALIYCDDGDAQITIDGTELVGTAANTYGIWEVGPNVNITMTSGSINTTKYCIVNNGTNTTTTSKWAITGGTLTSTESTAIYHAAPDSLIIGVDCDHGPVITGVNAAVEHRAGHLVIKGGTLTATGTPYSCTANASGTTTVGAAVAVAQHTTNVETTMDISCGTFEGESSISIANPQGNTGDNVDASITGGLFTGEVVTSDTRIDDYITGGTFDDATVIGELTNRIEPGYYPFDNGDGTTTVGRYSVVYHDNSTDDLQYAVMLPQNEDFPTTITITMPTTFTPVANSVVAWNTKADGSGAWYTEGSTVEISSYLDLYAHWVTVHNATRNIYYTTLQAAIDAANAGDSLVVLADMNIVETGDAGRIKVNKSIVINGEKHLITTKATRGLGLENGSNLDVTLRNFYMTCNNVTNQGSDAIRGVQIYNTSAGSHLLLDSCRIVVSGISDRGYALNFPGGADNVTVIVKNSYIQGWAALNCYSRNSTFIFDNDTLYGLNTQSTSDWDNFNTISIDGNNSNMGSNNNVSISKSVIIAEQRGTCIEWVFSCQNKATSNTIVVDCETKIVNGKGTDAQDVRDKLLINNQDCPYNSYTLPLTEEQKTALASDAAGRRFGLTTIGDEACGTMTMTKVSRSARNGRCAQDIGFHLYFDTENYANHVIAGGSAKLTLIEDVVLQKDETVDVNGRFLLFFKDWYNSEITHSITNNGHHIILAEGTSCGTDVEVPDSIFAVPAGFDGKIVHKSVTGQVHKFEYYAAPYVAINVNRDIKYTSLQTAADSVNTGDTVRLLRNITFNNNNDRVIITDKNLTIDLYGDTISTSFSGSSGSNYAAIQLKSGYLELKDSRGEGVIRATNRGSAVLIGTSTSSGGNASFTLKSGKLEGTAASNTWGLYVVLNDADSVVINGGEVSATGNGPALYNKQGKVVVNGGRIQGNGRAVYNYYAYNNTYFPTTILNGGEINGGNGTYACVDNDGGTFTMNGGTLNITGTKGISSKTNYYGGTGELYINGGVINDAGLTTNTINTTVGSKGKITFTGGTINLSNDNANAINISGQDTVIVTGGIFTATGANDILFNTSGNGAVVTIDDITATASTLFNCGATDSLTVNGGIYNTDVDWLINAGKIYLNGGIFTSSNTATAVNNGTLKVNKGWYSANMTSNTRSTKKYIARTGSEEPTYKDDAYLVPVDADAVTAASLTGTYYQLGNTITYHRNDGADNTLEQYKPIDESVTLLAEDAFTAPVMIAYWNTLADGTGTEYAPSSASPTTNADLDLYAQWKNVYNANTGRYYNNLQPAIDAATAGDSLVVLTDMSVNATVVVNKSIIINGQKHTIDATNAVIGSTKMALAIDEINLDVKIRNLNINGGNTCKIGVQVSGEGYADNCTVVIDSCRIYNFTHYAITTKPNSNGSKFTVSNSYIQGWTALSSYGGHSTFNFYNDTLRGINRQSGGNNDLNVITLNGQSTSSYGIQQANKVDIQKCVIIAEELSTSKEFWLGFSYGAKNDTVIVDCQTKIVDGPDATANNIADKIYMYEEYEYDEVIVGNAIIMPQLTDAQKANLSPYYTMVDATNGCDQTKVSLSSKYTANGAEHVMYIDFNYPFVANTIAANDKIELLEDVTMTRNDTINFTGNVKLNFSDGSVTHSITQGSYSIVLGDGATCTTDKQALELFSSLTGSNITETDNNDGTWTYSVTPYFWVTYNPNSGTGTIDDQVKPTGTDITLSDGTDGAGTYLFTKPDSTLYRWNTTPDEAAGSTNYALGATYDVDANLDLYAVWRLNLNMTMDSTDVVCYGENNGTDTVKIIGGEAPFQIVLSSTVMAENDTVKNLMDRTHIFTNLKPGKYNVQLTDVLKKDTIRGTFTIAQPDTLEITALTVPEDFPCPLMGSGVYNVSMTTTGGNGGNHFVWGEAAVNVDAMESTVIPGTDDRDSTYTVAVKVTDKKGCVATDTTTFSVSPVIADDGTVHSNSKLTIDTIKQGIMSGCDTVLRDFGTPHFTSTHPEINEGILDTIYNDIPTNYPDSVFPVGENVVIWTAVDTCGHMITGEQIIIIYHYPCPDVEMDGYTYHSVRLACDCWTDENLKTTKYSDGRAVDNIMKYQSPTHPDADANASVYGYLYDWSAALDAEGGVTVDAEGNVQGICPTGWHLPSDIEFMRVAGNGGEYDMSELRYHGYWLDGGGNNSTDFSLLPGGCYNDNTARYENLLGNAYLWSVNTADPSQPKMFWADCYCYMWQVDQTRPNMGCSVRCVKD